MKKMSKGEKLANLFFLLFMGECGPFGGEDPYLNKNELGLHSQCGTSWYIFNDDGSVDLDWDDTAEQELISLGYDNPYEDLQTHYDSIKDLLKSDDGWWYDASLGNTVKDLMEVILNASL